MSTQISQIANSCCRKAGYTCHQVEMEAIIAQRRNEQVNFHDPRERIAVQAAHVLGDKNHFLVGDSPLQVIDGLW